MKDNSIIQGHIQDPTMVIHPNQNNHVLFSHLPNVNNLMINP